MLPFRFFCPIASLDSLFSRSLPQGNSLLHRSSASHSRQNKLQHLKELCSFFAVRTGLEPATPGVTGRYSNQLNYRTNCSVLCVFLERGCKGTQKIGTTKFFAYFLLKNFLFDLNHPLFFLYLRLLQFRDDYLENSVIYVSLNVFSVCIVRE